VTANCLYINDGFNEVSSNHLFDLKTCSISRHWCTDNLQSLDLKVNKIYKDLLKSMFRNWYADEMGKNLHKDKKFEEIDMRLCVVNNCLKYNQHFIFFRLHKTRNHYSTNTCDDCKLRKNTERKFPGLQYYVGTFEAL
jgi:hypothetical protein